MISFDYSVLLGLYPGSTARSGSTGLSMRSDAIPDPTPPWDASVPQKPASQLLEEALRTRKFVDENAAKLDVPGSSEDYRKMFALFSGLNLLNAMAERASAKGVSTTERAQLERRFAAGLGEIGKYVDSVDLEKMLLVRGEAASRLKSTSGVRRDQFAYNGRVIHEGNADQPVAAFQGDVRFAMSVKRGLQTVVVNFDLAEMGATPRTLTSVLGYLNGKLAAADLQTRFTRERVPGAQQTTTINGTTVKLGTTPDRFALAIAGSNIETVSFTAPETTDAVYMAGASGKGDSAVNQLLKFQSDGGTFPGAILKPGDTHYVDGRAFQTTMGPEVDAVRATAAGPDGSVYVLGEVDAKTGDQTIKGDRDVVLLRYDAAGKLTYSRTVGAANSASGYALAVGPDGKVAVAGSVTGALDAGASGPDAKSADSFVTVFSADGDELWTRRQAATAADEARAVTFGADGSVFVVGRTRSAMNPSQTAQGDWDSYVQGFAANGTPTFTRQFGSAGADRATAVAVDGTSLLVGGVENGRAVVRRFDLSTPSSPVAAGTRDLGFLQGGEIAGLAVSGGRLIVAGTSANPGLDAGSVTRAHSGGTDAFAASLSLDLTADAADRLAYYGGAGEDTATGVAVSGGKVWLTGRAGAELPGSPSTGQKDGYLARLDVATGAVEWSRRVPGREGESSPVGIAVAQGGASVLDRLGLPSGTLDYSDSRKLVAATSLRAGDRFYVKSSEAGRPVAVTVGLDDTLATLAKKIERAAGFRARVEVIREGTYERLQIKPRDDRAELFVLPGEAGRDALGPLGLTEGLVRATVENDERPKAYGLTMPRDLDLSDQKAAQRSAIEIQRAMMTLRQAYRWMAGLGELPQTNQAATGTPPAYLQNQIANYQAALNRLTGGG